MGRRVPCASPLPCATLSLSASFHRAEGEKEREEHQRQSKEVEAKGFRTCPQHSSEKLTLYAARARCFGCVKCFQEGVLNGQKGQSLQRAQEEVKEKLVRQHATLLQQSRSVKENAQVTTAAETLIDVVDLPNPDASLLKGLAGQFVSPTDALLVIETYGVASAIRGVDAARKSADVALCALGLARDLGGKGYFTLCGELDAVEAAALAGRAAVTPGLLVGVEIIARPHGDTHLGLR